MRELSWDGGGVPWLRVLGLAPLAPLARARPARDRLLRRRSAAVPIAVETVEPPALLAFRDEDSSHWQSVDVAGRSTFEITATGPYRVAIACELGRGEFVIVQQLARTLDDEPRIEYPCYSADRPFVVRGTMVQPAKVHLGTSSFVTAASHPSFELQAIAGTFDLVMLTSDGKIAIRRDLQVSGDLQLGSIDLAQESPQQRVPTTSTATNLGPADTIYAEASLEAGGTFAHLHFGTGWSLAVVPRSALRSTDRQTISLAASEPVNGAGTLRRTRFAVLRYNLGEPTSITLPEPVGAVAYEATADRLAATWSTLPEYDTLTVQRLSSAPNLRIHALELTRAFVDATDATSAALAVDDLPASRPSGVTIRRSPRIATSRRAASSSAVTSSARPCASSSAHRPSRPSTGRDGRDSACYPGGGSRTCGSQPRPDTRRLQTMAPVSARANRSTWLPRCAAATGPHGVA
jgi:hypothetical protein